MSQQAGGYIVKNNYPEILTVGTGRNHELIAVETICYISSASPYVSIHTQGRKYLQLDSLRAFGERLNPDQFVRVHKSAIVNLRMLKSIKSRLNGDYDLVLRNGHQLRMSRNYVSDFRKSFKMNSSPQHNITSA